MSRGTMQISRRSSAGKSVSFSRVSFWPGTADKLELNAAVTILTIPKQFTSNEKLVTLEWAWHLSLM